MAGGEQIYKPKFEFTDSPTTNPGLQIATTKYDVINGDFINSENILSEYWDNGNQNFTIEDWGDGVYLIYKDDVAMGFTDQNGYDYLMGNSQQTSTPSTGITSRIYDPVAETVESSVSHATSTQGQQTGTTTSEIS